jgi:hypothetical protein
MKRVTELHQPKVYRDRCTLLHEMSHAIHHRVLGNDNQEVLAAYRQAMERKLLDPNMYATTNEREFFAEMSCAYFNHLTYYPKTRADLKKNDPVAFRLMERVWGQTPLPPAAPNQTSRLPPGFSLAEAVVGEPALGRKESIQTLQGQPVLLVYWNAKDASSLYCFRSVSAWYADLADFGLKIVAIHLGNEPADDLAAVVKARNIRVPVFACKWKDQRIVALRKDLPRALVFDHEGKCIFDGRPFDAERSVRTAAGEALLAKADISESETPLQKAVDALRAGKAPMAQLPEIVPLTASTDDAVKTEAQKLYDAIAAGPQLAFARAEELAKTDPVTAYLRANWLSTKYQGFSVGTQAASLVAALKQNRDVATEAQAQAALVHIRKLDNILSSHAGAFDPTLQEFQNKNAATLKKLHDAVQEMKKAFPDTKATEQAIAIGLHYGK